MGGGEAGGGRGPVMLGQTSPLPAAVHAPYSALTDTVALPPELERFVAEAIAAGRYRDVTEVVAAGVGLLQRAEAERAAFVRSLEDAEAAGSAMAF